MDVSVVVAIVGIAGSLATIFLTNRFTARAARRAHEQAVTIERDKIEAGSYSRARETYEAALKTNDQQLAALRGELDKERTDRTQAVASLRTDITATESELRATRTSLRKISSWCRNVMRMLDEQHVAYPPPPAELDEV